MRRISKYAPGQWWLCPGRAQDNDPFWFLVLGPAIYPHSHPRHDHACMLVSFEWEKRSEHDLKRRHHLLICDYSEKHLRKYAKWHPDFVPTVWPLPLQESPTLERMEMLRSAEAQRCLLTA